jgi:hypothetical protein
MARPKLPKDQKKDTVGIKLPPPVIDRIEELHEEWGVKHSAVGRELLLLGLAVYEAGKGNKTLARLREDSASDTAPSPTLTTRIASTKPLKPTKRGKVDDAYRYAHGQKPEDADSEGKDRKTVDEGLNGKEETPDD